MADDAEGGRVAAVPDHDQDDEHQAPGTCKGEEGQQREQAVRAARAQGEEACADGADPGGDEHRKQDPMATTAIEQRASGHVEDPDHDERDVE